MKSQLRAEGVAKRLEAVIPEIRYLERLSRDDPAVEIMLGEARERLSNARDRIAKLIEERPTPCP